MVAFLKTIDLQVLHKDIYQQAVLYASMKLIVIEGHDWHIRVVIITQQGMALLHADRQCTIKVRMPKYSIAVVKKTTPSLADHWGSKTSSLS